jgi:hypothetical protein
VEEDDTLHFGSANVTSKASNLMEVCRLRWHTSRTIAELMKGPGGPPDCGVVVLPLCCRRSQPKFLGSQGRLPHTSPYFTYGRKYHASARRSSAYSTHRIPAIFVARLRELSLTSTSIHSPQVLRWPLQVFDRYLSHLSHLLVLAPDPPAGGHLYKPYLPTLHFLSSFGSLVCPTLKNTWLLTTTQA